MSYQTFRNKCIAGIDNFDMSSTDNDGLTLLMHSCINTGDIEGKDLVDICNFVVAGADVNAKCTHGPWTGFSPLELACYDYRHIYHLLHFYSKLPVSHADLKALYLNRIKLLIKLGAHVTPELKEKYEVLRDL